MIFCYLVLAGLCCYGLLLLLPKGYFLQEIGQLPSYLWKVKQISLEGLERKKYRFGAHWRQYLILCQSQQTKNSDKPIIIYFHGGGWTFGSPEAFASNAKFFTDLGYTVFMPSYRRLPLYRSTTISKDCLLALEQIDSIIHEKNWQHRKIILAGMSAGANVAALLLFNKAGLESIKFERNRFAGILLNGAPLDLNGMYPTPLLYWYAGGKNSHSFANANPISYLNSEHDLPMLILHGTKDGMVAYQNIEYFVEKCNQLGFKNLTVHILENGTHLDVGRWAFKENNTAAWIKEWLSSL